MLFSFCKSSFIDTCDSGVPEHTHLALAGSDDSIDVYCDTAEPRLWPSSTMMRDQWTWRKEDMRAVRTAHVQARRRERPR